MKKYQSQLFLPLLAAFLLLVGSFVGCSKNNTSNPSYYLISTPDQQTMKEINYCKGCGTTNMNSYACIERQCMSQTGCMVDQDIFDTTVNDPGKWEKDKEEMYKVRDSFLINSTIGQWYITYYYELSNIAIQNNMINISNCFEYYNFSKDLINIVDQIKNGESSLIPIDIRMKTKAEIFITRFRANTTDELILSYLNNIQNDINRFTGKNVDYIRIAISEE